MEGIGRISGAMAAHAALQALDAPADPIGPPGALNQQMVAQEAAIRVLELTNSASASDAPPASVSVEMWYY